MDLPKFLLADNSQFPDDIFVVHTDYPSFILNMIDDEITWLEEFSKEDLEELEAEAEMLIEQATVFYDKEIKNYGDDY